MEEQDADIPEKDKFLIEKEPTKKISMTLIARTSLDSASVAELSEDEKIELILGIKSIHLQFLNLERIQNLEVFSKLMVLFLNHNNIKKIEGLETLVSLQYLALNNNQITIIQGINMLNSLEGLNLANNQIEFFKGSEFPARLQLVSLKNNPVSLASDYRLKLVKHLPELEVLDGEEITVEQKFKLQGIFPKHLVKYAENMKRIRQKSTKKSPELENFFGQGVFNEQQAMRQLKERTQQLLLDSKKEMTEKQQQQISNFEEKIKISKRVRQIVQMNAGKTIHLTEIKEDNTE